MTGLSPKPLIHKRDGAWTVSRNGCDPRLFVAACRWMDGFAERQGLVRMWRGHPFPLPDDLVEIVEREMRKGFK